MKILLVCLIVASAHALQKWPASFITSNCQILSTSEIACENNKTLTDFPILWGNYKILFLRNNNIVSIPKDALIHFPRIDAVYLDDNQIETIESGAFTTATNLLVLSLINNRLQTLTIAPGIAHGIKQLWISGNPLTIIHVPTFKNAYVNFNSNTIIKCNENSILKCTCDANNKYGIHVIGEEYGADNVFRCLSSTTTTQTTITSTTSTTSGPTTTTSSSHTSSTHTTSTTSSISTHTSSVTDTTFSAVTTTGNMLCLSSYADCISDITACTYCCHKLGINGFCGISSVCALEERACVPSAFISSTSSVSTLSPAPDSPTPTFSETVSVTTAGNTLLPSSDCVTESACRRDIMKCMLCCNRVTSPSKCLTLEGCTVVGVTEPRCVQNAYMNSTLSTTTALIPTDIASSNQQTGSKNQIWMIVVLVVVLGLLVTFIAIFLRKNAKTKDMDGAIINPNSHDGSMFNMETSSHRIIHGLRDVNTMESISSRNQPVYESIPPNLNDSTVFYNTANPAGETLYSMASPLQYEVDTMYSMASGEWVNPHIDYLQPHTPNQRPDAVSYDTASSLIMGDTSSLGDQEVEYEESHPDLLVVSEPPPTPPPRPSLRSRPDKCKSTMDSPDETSLPDYGLYDNANQEEEMSSGDEEGADEMFLGETPVGITGITVPMRDDTQYTHAGNANNKDLPPTSGKNTFYGDIDVYADNSNVTDVYASVIPRECRKDASNKDCGKHPTILTITDYNGYDNVDPESTVDI